MFWWWVGNLVGIALVVPLLVWLSSRLIRVSREVERYARDIAEHSGGIAGNLEPAPAALTGTRGLVTDVGDHAGSYVAALDRTL